MKDYLKQLVMAAPDGLDPRNVVREYLQSRMLLVLQRSGAMVPLAFHGGTALRFLYRIPRFSEYLDFALERPDRPYDFLGYVERIRASLDSEGYSVRARVNDKKVVNSASFGFAGLPRDLGLSGHRQEVFWVKLEVDTDPPQGAKLEVTIVDRFGLMRLQHHDLPSLFAGKLAAVLAREYTKGRDLYDLMWYLTDDRGPEPNMELLANALRQGDPDVPVPDSGTWRAAVAERLAVVSWREVRRDVERFLEHPSDADLLCAETFERLLGAGGGTHDPTRVV